MGLTGVLWGEAGGWCDSTVTSELWWVGRGDVAQSNMLKNRFNSFAHSWSPDSRPLPLSFSWPEMVFRPLQTSGIVYREALLQLPPVTVFASSYPSFQLLLHSPQFLLVPRFEIPLHFIMQNSPTGLA